MQLGWNVREREERRQLQQPLVSAAASCPLACASLIRRGVCRSPAICSRWYPLYTWASWWAPSQLVKTTELDPGGRYLLGIHPHGVLGNSSLLALGSEALGWSRLFPGIRLSQGEVQGAGRRSQC